MTSTPAPFLPYGRQTIDDDDIAAVTQVLRGDWLTGGPAVSAFEHALADHVKAPSAMVCSTGTSALHLAYAAIGVGEGDCVVVPAITFLATANAAHYLGAEVVFADVDPETGLMMPAHAEAAVLAAQAAGKKVKLLAPVHLSGQTGDPVGMADVASRYGAVVVEDACHALGTSYRDADGVTHLVGAGAHAALTCFSFHPVKTIAMGEGGAVTARMPDLDQTMRILRSHGMTRDPALFQRPDLALGPDGQVNPWYYEMVAEGNNYRATDIQCALGTSQLKKLDVFVARRRHLVDLYQDLLADVPGVRPLGRVAGSTPAWHLAVALIDFDGLGTDRATVMRALAAQGIGSQVHYMPVPWHPYWQGRAVAGPAIPGAESYYRRCLSLPLYPALQDGDVERVVSTLKGVLGA